MMGRGDLSPIIQNIASSEIREQYLDSDKARTRLGWSPGQDLEEGLRRTIEWYRKFFAQAEAQGGCMPMFIPEAGLGA
jgi:CDP-glucose 4,6-dehydratase